MWTSGAGWRVPATLSSKGRAKGKDILKEESLRLAISTISEELANFWYNQKETILNANFVLRFRKLSVSLEKYVRHFDLMYLNEKTLNQYLSFQAGRRFMKPKQAAWRQSTFLWQTSAASITSLGNYSVSGFSSFCWLSLPVTLAHNILYLLFSREGMSTQSQIFRWNSKQAISWKFSKSFTTGIVRWQPNDCAQFRLRTWRKPMCASLMKQFVAKFSFTWKFQKTVSKPFILITPFCHMHIIRLPGRCLDGQGSQRRRLLSWIFTIPYLR